MYVLLLCMCGVSVRLCMHRCICVYVFACLLLGALLERGKYIKTNSK